jgi:hypothetical protein
VKDAPNLWSLRELDWHLRSGPQIRDGAAWYPARPIGFYSLKERLRLAWLVFTGKADALTWSDRVLFKPGELYFLGEPRSLGKIFERKELVVKPAETEQVT